MRSERSQGNEEWVARHQAQAAAAFRDRRNDTLDQVCTDIATKTFTGQYPSSAQSAFIAVDCFIAVAIYPAASRIFDWDVAGRIGSFYEYHFNGKYNLLVRYGFMDSQEEICSLLEETALAYGRFPPEDGPTQQRQPSPSLPHLALKPAAIGAKPVPG